jgi:choline dehydrogenase-like flavoprotein
MTTDRLIEADLCIVGAGPAGIAIALQLVGRPLRVVLVESGGLGFERAAQDLANGRVVSPQLSPDAIRVGRRRQFGGTANAWIYRTTPDDGRRYARSLPPEAIDLSLRPSVPGSGWPFDLADLAPFYARAQRLWNGAAFDYDPAHWWSETGDHPAWTFPGIDTRLAQHGSGDVFSTRYRDDLFLAENVDVLVGTTVRQLIGGPSGDTVTTVEAVTHRGEAVSVRAKAFVLAGGGVENASLLLQSPLGVPGGAANPHDVVGRFLTDHPEFHVGTIQLSPAVRIQQLATYDLRWAGTTLVGGFLTLPESLKRDEGLLNFSVALAAHAPGYGTPTHRAVQSLVSRSAGGPRDIAAALSTAAKHPRDVLRLARSRRSSAEFREFSGGWSISDAGLTAIELHGASEQTPDAENRVVLERRLDRLGRPRPAVTWRWSVADQDNVARSISLLRERLTESGIGSFVPWTRLGHGARHRFDGLHHPMGATRIDRDGRFGVVDAECRVHGLANLFIAGSSVFPSGHGYANPTLTVLALAIRLGDHLLTVLGV